MSPGAWALGSLEGRKLLRHPLFLVGVGFVLIGTAFFVRTSLVEPVIAWDDNGWMVGAGMLLLGMLTMIATNLAALRDRRAGTTEQHDTLPLPRATRTGGLLIGMLWPGVACTALLVAIAAYAASTTDLVSLDLIHLAGAVVLVLTLGALGVAIARWFPNPFVAPVVAWGLILTSPGDSSARWLALSPFASAASIDLALWHLVYLTGLAVGLAGAAMWRERARGAAAASIAGLAVASGAAIVTISGA